jgi:TfoX/Sxy family transcriptional regulator of competence genes
LFEFLRKPTILLKILVELNEYSTQERTRTKSDMFCFCSKQIPEIMAYNEQLANRVRERLTDLPEVEEKEMMGGLVFMVNDKMCVGVVKNDLMCRIDREFHETAVEMNGCRTMDFTKRPMKGYVLVDETGLETNKEFDFWINLSLEFNKIAKSSKRKKE